MLGCMTFGCGIDVGEPPAPDLRHELLPPGCSAENGDTQFCDECVVQRDVEWICENENRLEAPSQLAMNGERVYADYMYKAYQGWHSVVFEGDELLFRTPTEGLENPPLGTAPRGFSGTGIDGTVYYHYPAGAYLHTSSNEWQEVGVPDLPPDFRAGHGFHVRPSASGELHATFVRGDPWTGYIHFATQNEDLSWKSFPIADYDPNQSGHHVGVDAWDRPYALINSDDWGDGPQTLLKFPHTYYVPVGTHGSLGRVADPPRPTTALEGAPIHVLRDGLAHLELLSIVDGDDWQQADVDGTKRLETCPESYQETKPECPPCHSEGSGIEAGAFDVARTSDGVLWASWFVVHATVDVEYTPVPKALHVLCQGSLTSTQTGALHLAALDKQGSVVKELVVPVTDLGLHIRYGKRPTRELSMAAWDRQVAVMFPTHQRGPNQPDKQALTMRMLVFDTSML
jgi:hypothetical protein